MEYNKINIKKRIEERFSKQNRELGSENEELILLLTDLIEDFYKDLERSENKIKKRLLERLGGNEMETRGITFGVVCVSTPLSFNLSKKEKITFRKTSWEEKIFSPAIDSFLTGGDILYRIDEKGIIEYVDGIPKDRKNLQFPFKNILFIGLNLKDVSNCNFLFWPTFELIKKEPFDCSRISFWSENMTLSCQTLKYMNKKELSFLGHEKFGIYSIEKHAVDCFSNQILSVDMTQFENTKKMPAELPEVLRSNLGQSEFNFEKVTHWLEIRQPAGFEYPLADVQIFLNPVPVINRYYQEHSVNEVNNIEDQVFSVLDENSSNSRFLALDSVRGNAAEPYREVTFRPFFQMPPGSFQLYRHGINGSESSELIHELRFLHDRSYRILKELSLLHHLYDNNDIKEIGNVLGRIKIAMEESERLNSSNYFLRIKPRTPREQLRYGWWMVKEIEAAPNYLERSDAINDEDLKVLYLG